MGLEHILNALLPPHNSGPNEVTVVDPKTGKEYEVDKDDLNEK